VDLNQILSDGTNTYLYGLGRIAQENTETEYFLTDALGSVRQLTDSVGAITYTSAFDPFGAVTQAYGASQTNYGFTGEFTDPNELVYLRARHFAPEMGRFITLDAFSGYLTLPQSQNPYAYALNNPVQYTDPSGNIVPLLLVPLIGFGLGAGIDLAIQLYRSGGRWECVDWGEVVIAGGAGAVAGLVAFYAFPVFLPATGATFANFVIAGGLSGIIAGQVGRSTSLLLSGNGDQIISSFAQPDDVLTDFGFGAVFGGIGYGIQRVANSISSGLRISVGVPDEFLPPSATGQFRNWNSTWEQYYYRSGGGNNRILDNVIAYNQSLIGRPTTLSIDEVFWAQRRVSPNFTDGITLAEGVSRYQNNPYPIRVFEKQPWMNQVSPQTHISSSGETYTGDWTTMYNGEYYTLNNRSYTVATMGNRNNIPVRWASWDEIWEYSYQFSSESHGREIFLFPNGPMWDGGMIR
jgi:RHS repeat-associated protein